MARRSAASFGRLAAGFVAEGDAVQAQNAATCAAWYAALYTKRARAESFSIGLALQTT